MRVDDVRIKHKRTLWSWGFQSQTLEAWSNEHKRKLEFYSQFPRLDMSFGPQDQWGNTKRMQPGEVWKYDWLLSIPFPDLNFPPNPPIHASPPSPQTPHASPIPLPSIKNVLLLILRKSHVMGRQILSLLRPQMPHQHDRRSYSRGQLMDIIPLSAMDFCFRFLHWTFEFLFGGVSVLTWTALWRASIHSFISTVRVCILLFGSCMGSWIRNLSSNSYGHQMNCDSRVCLHEAPVMFPCSSLRNLLTR